MLKILLPLVVGWLLGLISTIGLDLYRDYRRRTNLIKLLKTELRDLRYRLVALAESSTVRYGKYDRTFMNWIAHRIVEYDETEEQKKMARMYSEIRTSDQALELYREATRAKNTGGLFIPNLQTPGLDQIILSLTLFNQQIQEAILKLLNETGVLIDVADQADDYLDRTFEPGLTQDSYRRISSDLDASYARLGQRAQKVVEAIELVQKTLN